MVRWGKTAAGIQRWQCTKCNKGQCRKRSDVTKRNTAKLMGHWLLNFNSLTSIAKQFGVHRNTLSRKFNASDTQLDSIPLNPFSHDPVLVLDGTAISKKIILILAHDAVSNQPVAWSFVRRENFESWHKLLSHIRERFTPRAFVSDGQKGLQKAIKMIFPTITHQRCLAHVIRLSLAWLTRNPQTDAGWKLRVLVRELALAKTEDRARSWHNAFTSWDECYKEFLKEKSCNPETNRKWYTHRKLRAVRSLVANALPNLFWFASDAKIPNTTNAVEGGINSPLAELLHRHRGITEKQKKALVRRFLYVRRRSKLPTRNVA